INIINIFLMLVSFGFAFLFPFELFLIMYAVLGPLHYLTEINWLHKKNYFTTQKNDYYIHVVLLFLITLALFTPLSYYLRKYLAVFIFIAFCSSFGMIYFKETKSKVKFNTITTILSFLCFYTFESHFNILFSMFLPTLIHVFIFTGLFILIGTLKVENRFGKCSLIIFIVCGIGLLIIPINYNFSIITEQIQNNYHSFEKLNQRVIILVNQFSSKVTTDIYFSNIGIQVMRFIAFAYTYHYFNWFSKTSIIQWHNTSLFKIIIIIVLWIMSMVLYFYDYNLGLKWLYILSLAHVVLEFPLNFISILSLKYIFRNNC
ncbi:MAG: hypothetical protein ABNG98_02590, partial [Flavobacterium sp.]